MYFSDNVEKFTLSTLCLNILARQCRLKDIISRINTLTYETCNFTSFGFSL